MNLQFGCGKCAPENWVNFDISPTLKLERIPLIGGFFSRKEWGSYPKNVKIGNIVTGLPAIESNSCDNIYSSHVLEHLSYEDMKMALNNTFNMLKIGGTFRFVIPDMEYFVNEYLDNKKSGNKNACNKLMSATLMGEENNIKGLKNKIINLLGNSKHQWNYDFDSMYLELQLAGFKNIRRAYFNDSKIKDFLEIEDLGRWGNYCLGIECNK